MLHIVAKGSAELGGRFTGSGFESASPVPVSAAVRAVAAALSLVALMLLVRSQGAIPVLAGAVLLSAAVFLLLLPDWAPAVVAFLLYINIPRVLVAYGLPSLLASSFLLLLAVPLVHHLAVKRAPLLADSRFHLLGGFFVVLVLSALVANGGATSKEYIKTFVQEGLILFWLVTNSVRTLPSLQRVIWAMLLAGALVSGLTLYQEVTGSYSNQFGGLAQRHVEYIELTQQGDSREAHEEMKAYEGVRSMRPGGPVGQANRFGQILVVLLPLAALAHRAARSRRSRALALGSAGLILIGIGLTQSRGAFLMVVVVTAVLVAFRWLRASYALVVATLIVIAIPIISPSFGERIGSISSARLLFSDERSTQGEVDGAIRGRATEMLAALHVFIDHPVLGVGPGRFPDYVESYSDQPGIQFKTIDTERRAHSLYLEMAAETGLVGLFVFLVIVGSLLRALWLARRRVKQLPELADVATALFLTLLAYLGTGVFEHLSYQRYFWFLLAVANSGLHILRSHETEREPVRALTTPRPS